jgi:hypothetical protein
MIIALHCGLVYGQSYNHWSNSFNEESSLVSGAVVGGGAGPSAIFYNPASISEITESKFSFHISLSSVSFVNLENALGNGIDMKRSEFLIQPRFISFMVKPKNNPDWSFEFATLNYENYLLDITGSVDTETDILTYLPGEERYFATYQYYNKYRDNWYGFGSSWKISPVLSLGFSMFVTVKSLEYRNEQDIVAYPIDSVFIDGIYKPFYAASYQSSDYLKYNDYRLVWKLGLLYKKERYSLGLTITTPSLGGMYSDGKRVTNVQSQSNITDPETGLPLPDYYVGDYQDKENVHVNNKTAFAVAAGFTLHSRNKTKVLYTTVEYFGGISPYKLVTADQSPYISEGIATGNLPLNDWLTYVGGAKPVFNAAIGYSWKIRKDLLMLAGFRTDFNYRKGFDYAPYLDNATVKGLELDYYHITGGLSFSIFGQNIIAGVQYSIGAQRNLEQFANLSDPIEYDNVDNVPLQGVRQNTMNAKVNSIILYFGATFNFGGNKEK